MNLRQAIQLYSRLLKREPGRRSGRKAHLAWWLQHLGDRPLGSITPSVIDQAYDHLMAHGGLSDRPASSATVTRYASSLSHLYSWAQRKGLCERNPVAGSDRPKEPPGRTRYLTPREAEDLISAAKKQGWLVHLWVILALASGARKGELGGLRWSRMEWGKDVAWQQLATSKNGRPRVLYFHGEAYRGLLQRKYISPFNLVLANSSGRAIFPRHEWEATVAWSGIRDLRFHDLRHTTASWMLAQGASLMHVKEALGHSSIATTARYSHLEARGVSEALARAQRRDRLDMSGA